MLLTAIWAEEWEQNAAPCPTRGCSTAQAQSCASLSRGLRGPWSCRTVQSLFQRRSPLLPLRYGPGAAQHSPHCCPFRDDHGFSPLHWACREGRSNVVDMLIMRGARINVMNRGDDTPLHLAASHGHRDIVQKVPPSALGVPSSPALLLPPSFRALAARTSGCPRCPLAALGPLPAAAPAGSAFPPASGRWKGPARGSPGLSCLQLIQFKADINAVNEHGNTPLHYACFWGHDTVAEVSAAPGYRQEFGAQEVALGSAGQRRAGGWVRRKGARKGQQLWVLAFSFLRTLWVMGPWSALPTSTARRPLTKPRCLCGRY